MKKHQLFLGTLLAAFAFAGGALAVTTFTDVPADHWASTNIQWAADANLVKGDDGKSTFRPDDSVSRAELVTVMKRYDDRMANLMEEMALEMETELMEMALLMEEMAFLMEEMAEMIEGEEVEEVVEEEEGDLVDVAETEGFTTLVAAIEAAGLTATLQGDGPFTVFAPTNAAFEALEEGEWDALLADTDRLAEVLSYHVVSGELLAADVVAGSLQTLLEGEMVEVTTEGGVMVNDANVTTTDVMASNGVIHVIDMVLMPSAE